MDYDFLKVSDGTGDAALMHVQTLRAPASTTIDVDTVAGVPAKFIATYGKLLASGLLDPSSKRDFKGHVSGSDLVIDGFMPGSTDNGNAEGDVVVIKPNSHWANKVAIFIQNMTNNGTPANTTVAALAATAITATTLATSGDVTVGGNIAITGTSRVVPATVVTSDGSNNITPTKQRFSVTALDHAATILAPTWSPQEAMSGALKIKDNGTARALTWNANWVPIGVTLPTTTVLSKWLYVFYEYNAADSKWHVLGLARE